MASLSRRSRYSENTWPGFVDALATLLMVIIFLLMVFVLAQVFLSDALSGRERDIDKLGGQVSELGDLLALERVENKNLRNSIGQLGQELEATLSQRDTLTEANSKLVADITKLNALKAELEAEITEFATKLQDNEGALLAEKELSESARAEVALLNQQTASLKEQLLKLNTTLRSAEDKAAEQNDQIVALGKRLNAALAGKVQELSKYRSEFFGQLREVLGNHPGIRVVGDRFVFQSEVLFKSGEATLGDEGKVQLAQLATTLLTISAKIPDTVEWILRVDGHTDRVPIYNNDFQSNWELSTARALSVVRYLVKQGLPASRLAATGFGEFHPIDPGRDEIANRRNRRIELKLTQQ